MIVNQPIWLILVKLMTIFHLVLKQISKEHSPSKPKGEAKTTRPPWLLFMFFYFYFISCCGYPCLSPTWFVFLLDDSVAGRPPNIPLIYKLVLWNNYRKDTKPLYHAFVYSPIILLSSICIT